MSTFPRSRKFALVSYIEDTGELLTILQHNGAKIRAYAMIKHDKDEVDPHHHIVLRTYNAFTAKQVACWFNDSPTNSTGANTFAQFVEDDQGILDYLTHNNDPDKHQYAKSDIIDGGLSDLLPKNSRDDSADIVQDMLDNVSTAMLVRRYGRDFIYHYQQYATIVGLIRSEGQFLDTPSDGLRSPDPAGLDKGAGTD